VVADFDFALAIKVGGAVCFGLKLAVAVGLDRVVALLATADLWVVFDVFVPVA
jgi:hypothetical protein